MSDLMLHGILNMPIDIWGDDPLDKFQRHSRYVEASRLISRQQEDLEDFKSALVKAEKELTSLRQYKAEAESQRALLFIRPESAKFMLDLQSSVSARFSLDFRTDDAIEDFNFPLYARPVPAGSCAVPEKYSRMAENLIFEACQAAIEKLIEIDPDSGWDSAESVAEMYINRLRVSAIPSNSEGEKS